MEQKRKHHRGRRNKKRNIVSNIILVIALSVFIFSAYKLISIYSEYHKGDKEYDSILEEAIEVQTPESEVAEQEEQEHKPKVHSTLKVDFCTRIA